MKTTRRMVSDDHANRRIDTVVGLLWQIPRNQAGRLVADGHVTVNGVTVAKAHRCTSGDVLELTEQPEVEPVPAPPMPPVVYDDDQIIIIDKPAGLVVHPGVGNDSGTLVDALRHAGVSLADTGDATRPGIVHRLDKDTSGVLVVAKTATAYDSIVMQLRERSMRRSYIALVVGVPRAPRGVIDGPIGRDPKARTRFAVVDSGKPARTHYLTRACGTVPKHPSQQVSLLDVTLDTGRTHQIRVHLATIGVGIVGDAMYGVTGTISAQLGLTRPFLHAETVELQHPVSGEMVRATAPVPTELVVACQRAGIAL
ncbi:MAG: RluA family pseudouridine synthase [Nitriliruptoraceae bacterium]